MSKLRIRSAGRAPSEAIHLAVVRASPASKASVSSLDAPKEVRVSHSATYSTNLRRCLAEMEAGVNSSNRPKGRTS